MALLGKGTKKENLPGARARQEQPLSSRKQTGWYQVHLGWALASSHTPHPPWQN